MVKSMVSFARRVPTDHAEVSSLRRSATEWLRAELYPDLETVVADMSVVVTELMANVIDHTEALAMDVVLDVADGCVTIEVTN